MKLILKLMSAGLCVTAIAACATATQTYGPDGRVSHSLNCSGLARNWGMCLEKAGELCGSKGYDIVNATGDSGAFVAANAQQLTAMNTISRSMLVSCKQ